MIDFDKLKAPFPPEAISWRVGSTTKDKSKGMALAYIDSRDVQQRLDDVCGLGGWQCRYPHAGSKTICEIGVKVDDEWVWKADGAGDSEIEAEKGAISDAFKRAAVKWGIGRYLYDLDSPWVELDTYERDGKKFVKGIAKGEFAKLEKLLGGTPKRDSAVPTNTPLPAGLEPKPTAERPEIAEYLQKVSGLLDNCINDEEIDSVLKAGATQRKSIGLLEGSPYWGAFKTLVSAARQAVEAQVPA